MRGVILLILSLMLISISSAIEIDSKASVTNVVDGDTIDVYATSGFGAGTEYRIRFADINAPELSTIEGQLAKLALQDLLDSKTVYIDVDDITTYDPYNRVVAVVYLPVNSTHVMNVNYYMVLNGYAEIWDFTNNEFDPYTWRLYEPLTALRKVVNINTSEEFSSIQSAISDPETRDGHVIVVYPGIYEENVVINKSVKLISSTQILGDVVLKIANESLPVVDIIADNVTISGFKIEGSSSLYDYAVKVFGDNCRIINNEISNYYGDIYVYNSSYGLISGNKFSEIRVLNSSNLNISGNTIDVYDETGILCANSFNITITENAISGVEKYGNRSLSH